VNNKPINLYWSPFFIPNYQDASFLYKNPTTLYSELQQYRKKGNTGSYLSCPAMFNKMKKTLVFKNVVDSSYEYNQESITPTIEGSIGLSKSRESSLNIGPTLNLSYSVVFFADEPVTASFTSPYFHKSQYTKYGSICPGEFDVGQWFRPYDVEIQMWDNEGVFNLKKDEPMFYSEFKTTKPINLHRFELNDKLRNYCLSCINTTQMFGRGQSLLSRYEKFKNIGFKEKILTEIKKNIIEEEPFKF
jgi:hypothetical protein